MLGLAACFLAFDNYWLDAAIVAPVLGVSSVFVSSLRLPFILHCLISFGICWGYIITVLCGMDLHSVTLSNLLLVLAEVGFLSLNFGLASWYNERSMRRAWALMRANLTLTKTNRQMKTVLNEVKIGYTFSLIL